MLQIRKTEMRNIKIVDVYTGYGENSISWIKEDRFGGEIKNIVDDVFEKYVVDKMRADDWEEFSDDGEEMYEVCGVCEGVGFISYGEEDMLLVIEEGYKLITNDTLIVPKIDSLEIINE